MNWTLVYTAKDDAEAMVIQSMLEGSGIPAKLAKESVGRIEAINVDGLGEVKIFVPEEKAEDAAALIASFDATPS